MSDAWSVDVEAFMRVRQVCLRFGDAERAEIQGRRLFRVGRRRFVIFNSDYAPPRERWRAAGCSLHFLADPAEHDALLSDSRFRLSPHHGNRGWLALRLDGESVDWAEVEDLITSAHAQVTQMERRN